MLDFDLVDSFLVLLVGFFEAFLVDFGFVPRVLLFGFMVLVDFLQIFTREYCAFLGIFMPCSLQRVQNSQSSFCTSFIPIFQNALDSISKPNAPTSSLGDLLPPADKKSV